MLEQGIKLLVFLIFRDDALLPIATIAIEE